MTFTFKKQQIKRPRPLSDNSSYAQAVKLELVLNNLLFKQLTSNYFQLPTFFLCTLFTTPTFLQACTLLSTMFSVLSPFQTPTGRHACKYKHVHTAFVGVIYFSSSHFLRAMLVFRERGQSGSKRHAMFYFHQSLRFIISPNLMSLDYCSLNICQI